MGLMMWMMMRSGKGEGSPKPPAGQEQPASVEVLREEQRRLSAEIDRLEADGAAGTETGAVERK
jgi:hypothetical protein